MAAPYHDHGHLSRTLRWIRIWADEPAYGSAKYSDAQLCEMLEAALDQITIDLYNQASSPPLAQYSATLVVNQRDYLLPVNFGEWRRIAKIHATTGMPEWEIVPRSNLSPIGPGVRFNAHGGFSMLPIPQTSGDIITFDYIPMGHLKVHQNAVPLRDGSTLRITDDDFYLNASNTSWFLGTFDRRPNAYIGQVVRLLGTTHDVIPSMQTDEGTVPWFPIQERRIDSYDLFDSAKYTVAPDWDLVDWTGLSDNDSLGAAGDPQTYLVYEVLPDVDPAVVYLAGLDVAVQILSIEKKREKRDAIQALLERKKRAAQLRWANMDTRVGSRFESDTVDAGGFWHPWEI